MNFYDEAIAKREAFIAKHEGSLFAIPLVDHPSWRCLAWCSERLGHNTSWAYRIIEEPNHDPNMPYGWKATTTFFFLNRDDALLFKLTFGGAV